MHMALPAAAAASSLAAPVRKVSVYPNILWDHHSRVAVVKIANTERKGEQTRLLFPYWAVAVICKAMGQPFGEV